MMCFTNILRVSQNRAALVPRFSGTVSPGELGNKLQNGQREGSKSISLCRRQETPGGIFLDYNHTVARARAVFTEARKLQREKEAFCFGIIYPAHLGITYNEENKEFLNPAKATAYAISCTYTKRDTDMSVKDPQKHSFPPFPLTVILFQSLDGFMLPTPLIHQTPTQQSQGSLLSAHRLQQSIINRSSFSQSRPIAGPCQ
ncbi:hypothetical protein EXN66_Car019702 [Channa argus]|uniref:Uncharacterized protein n=1 Tax=Channa argus TaxID=215402 RepID=A0A6G1QNG0_CHAAH|nr:hypothetical protein EXN66_Car019702 [Channa argus]